LGESRVTQTDIQTNGGVANSDTGSPKKIRHRQWGGAAFGLLVSIVGLVAGRLGHLHPRFDVFSQFGVQFVAMALAFSCAMLFSRYKTLFGIAITAALLAAYGAWPHLVSSSLQSPPYQMVPDEKLLRLAHFNTYKNNDDFAAIAAEVLRLDADVVNLVEMSTAKKQAVLPLLKGKYPYIYDCKGGRYCDMAIASIYPIIEADGEGEWVGAPCIRVTLGGDMAGVTVVGVHTTRFPFSRAQLTQVRELVKKLETYPGELVVMGDFNATPFSRVTTTLEQGANLTRLTELPTWPSYAQLPQLAIDHIFASKAYRVVGNEQIGHSVGSDHFPILMTLAVKLAP
jgi:endonuclease/exonuclease/phosphatase (EEP) superfamily protein YafD